MRGLRFVTLAAVLSILGTPLALGAMQTRGGYVGAVEPICERNTKANEQNLAGLEGV